MALRRALALALLLAPGAAAAVEGESSLAVTGRFATLSAGASGQQGDVSGAGGGLGVDYQRGFGDTWWFRAAVGGNAFAVEGQGSYAALAVVGVTYAVDVIKYVPYIGVGGGAIVVGGGAVETVVEPYLELGVGLEVLQSTTFSWGIDARFSSFVGDATIFLIGPRVSWKWGYF
jgi:hypothetical protein